jgi:outer membrane protein
VSWLKPVILAMFAAVLYVQPLYSQLAPGAVPDRITMADAERIALAHNPDMSIAHLLELAAKESVRETRSAELPTVWGNLTAVDARDGSRITAGLLNNPVLFTRAAGGFSLNQLVTDFGRTRDLIHSSESERQAQSDKLRATRAEIMLAVDRAFLQALIQQQVLQVAQQTVEARQATADEIEALTHAKLKSALDLSFANVELSKAQLLLLDARASAQDALANLMELLGVEKSVTATLVDQDEALTLPESRTADELTQAAFQARPDLAELNADYRSATQFSAAEHDLNRPTISALAAAGNAPLRNIGIVDSWYGAAGINVSIPVFNGFLFSARAREADLKAATAKEAVNQRREIIARDVRTTLLGEQTAYQRIAVARQLLEQATQALELAQARYKLGLSSIVELSQAQLSQTEAEIGDANARYSYRIWTAEMRYQLGQ